jgi:hypothetical protein
MSDVNKFGGSILGLVTQTLAVVKIQVMLNVTILRATYVTSESGNVTAEEGAGIVITLSGDIEPIQTSLDALKAKVCSS